MCTSALWTRPDRGLTRDASQGGQRRCVSLGAARGASEHKCPPLFHLWAERRPILPSIPFGEGFITNQRAVGKETDWLHRMAPCTASNAPVKPWHMLPRSSWRCFCIPPAPSPNDTFGLIWEAYTAIHLRWYGGKKRFMSHNKLLGSCMWWGNQKRKWAGNSLLHATLIHPSVRGTSPLCTPHLKGP